MSLVEQNAVILTKKIFVDAFDDKISHVVEEDDLDRDGNRMNGKKSLKSRKFLYFEKV